MSTGQCGMWQEALPRVAFCEGRGGGKSLPSHDLKAHGAPFDVISYNCAISASAWQEAPRLLQEMCAKRHDWSAVTLNAAMTVCQRAAQWLKCVALLRCFKARLLKPTQVSYAVSIGAGEWQAGLLLLQMLVVHLRPNPILYNVGIASTAWQWASEFFRELAAQKLESTVVTENSAIASLAKAGQWQTALAFASRRIDVAGYGAMANACERGHRWPWSLQVLQCMQKQRLRRNIITCNAGLGACKESGQWKLGIGMFKELQHESLKPSVSTQSALVSTVASGGLWREGLLLGRREATEPTVIAASAAITACEKGTRWEVAVTSLQRLHCCRLRATETTYSAFTVRRSSYIFFGSVHFQ